MDPSTSANNSADRHVVGIDMGTLSARAMIVRVSDGAELGSAVHEYAHGVADRQLPGSGHSLGRDWALQVPEDYREVLRHAVPKAVAASGIAADRVVGVGTDFTACTVLPTLADGTPLCEVDGLRDRPHAYPKLWKHHAAQAQADRVTSVAAGRGEPWLARYGGRISSEWEFAKALQVLEEDPEVYARTERWIEAADWIVWQLTGHEIRNICTAGYKGLYQDGSWPSREYLAALNPDFAGFVDDKLAHPLSQLGEPAGGLTEQAAAWTGLRAGIPVAVGNVDAHVTASAANALEPGQMLAIMGTSTCHIMNSDVLGEVPGMCGVVRDGVVPGLWGYEAGQSGVGDIFAWLADSGVPEPYVRAATERGISLHEVLTEKAADQAVGEHGLVALDWLSGNRSVLVDHELSGVVAGLTLATRPEDVYRALMEATAFGARTIVEAFERGGVPVRTFAVAGGLIKNPFLMQLYADVLRRPLDVVASEQAPALGSAIHAAVAAGCHPDIRAASDAMGGVEHSVYVPDSERADAYDELYSAYTELHDHFGRGGTDVLHRLRQLRDAAVAR